MDIIHVCDYYNLFHLGQIFQGNPEFFWMICHLSLFVTPIILLLNHFHILSDYQLKNIYIWITFTSFTMDIYLNNMDMK